MTALPLHAPIVRLASQSVPDSLRRLFQEAELAEPPVSLRDLTLDTDAAPGARKTLLAFSADPADVNLFILLSPALQRVGPTRLEDPDPVLAAEVIEEEEEIIAGSGHLRLSRVARSVERITPEPDFPWWQPEPFGPGRRFAYSTPDFDFIEVIIEDLSSTVFVRAIG